MGPVLRFACVALALAAGSAGSAEARRAAPPALTAASINDAAYSEATRKQTSAALIRAEVLLDRLAFSPGVIDGRPGENVAKAIAAFQRAHDLDASGRLNRATYEALLASASAPAIVDYTITEEDVRGPFVEKLPAKLEDEAKLPYLGYRSPAELLAEKFHVSQQLLKALNPRTPLNRTGEVIAVPNVLAARPAGAVTRVEVDKARKVVRAYGPDHALVAFYPASIGSAEKPAPSGEFRVRRISRNPDYRYDPKFHFKGVKADKPFTIAPGPNSPVGLVWIDLSKPSYGIHGTPDPEKIGKTQSHGCVRLTNWDALDLAARLRTGATVAFIDAEERVGEAGRERGR